MENSEREDLDALVRSDGWRVFCRYVEGEWGNGGQRFVQGVQLAANDPNLGTDKLRQVIVAQREIQSLCAWPERRVKELSKPELVALGSRRGAL